MPSLFVQWTPRKHRVARWHQGIRSFISAVLYHLRLIVDSTSTRGLYCSFSAFPLLVALLQLSTYGTQAFFI
ncbi:hypothetical protein BDV23DRAFT_157262 [Aspergillus alliaceus]|uniref:Uncharacterized protein n=1 Tax=Petromyces alliaceus TaxID=209559 RepID=A0A5N7C6A2_PETAA|nr:hypothetical protein BDV23DRAFT_157262 [Aspergillus alliaceus]